MKRIVALGEQAWICLLILYVIILIVALIQHGVR